MNKEYKLLYIENRIDLLRNRKRENQKIINKLERQKRNLLK